MSIFTVLVPRITSDDLRKAREINKHISFPVVETELDAENIALSRVEKMLENDPYTELIDTKEIRFDRENSLWAFDFILGDR